ncbi:MAG: hypothetical protein ABI855_03615 [Bacteroidota bacterium]
MKNLNHNAANKMEQSTLLMSFKRSAYKQKSIFAGYNIQHPDLSWIQINGYQPKMNSVDQLQMNGTAYHRIELLKAQHKFYSVALAGMMAGLLFLASVL